MIGRRFFFIFVVILSCQAAWGGERPNFLWLISEDNSKHYLKLFDAHGAATPQIEALAARGMVFERAFSCSPVCSVARTTLITGCYAPRLGTQYHRRSVTVPLPGDLRMFPAYLRQAGYYTTNNQKKDYNALEGDEVWDESSGRAHWRGRRPGQPFFHKQSFGTTHESSLHFSAEEMSKQPPQTDPKEVHVAPIHPDTPIFRHTYARYHDRIRAVDTQIGEVLAELEQDGLLEETFVFYFADHGGVLPGSKGYVYERGLHIPLVVRIPEKWKHLVDAPPGARVGGFVSFVDFGPTLLHLAGVKVPAAMDGRPFLGEQVKMSGIEARDEAFGYADRFDEKYDLVRTLRKGRFKYLRSYQPFNMDGLQNNYRYRMLAYQEWRALYQAGKLNDIQRQFFEPRAPEALYDVETDPYETRNLAADPKHRETLVDLRRRLTERVKNLPDLSFFPESYLVAEAFDNPAAFAREHREEIGTLVDIANLSLVPFPEARPALEQAFSSENPWKRYWALIVCSSHGASARPLAPQARRLASEDPEKLVQVRAAEFLGLIEAADPRPVIMKALASSPTPMEAALILNTVVLLQDGKPGYPFEINPMNLPQAVRESNECQRRLEYLEESRPKP